MLGAIEREGSPRHGWHHCAAIMATSAAEKKLPSTASLPRLAAITAPPTESLESFSYKVLSTLLWRVRPPRFFSPASDHRAHHSIRSISMIILICSLHSGTFSFSVFCGGFFCGFFFSKVTAAPFIIVSWLKAESFVLSFGYHWMRVFFLLLFGKGGWGIQYPHQQLFSSEKSPVHELNQGWVVLRVSQQGNTWTNIEV